MTEYHSRRYALVNRWDPAHLRKVDRLLELEAGDRVLEVGCGQGHLVKRLAERGIDAVGVDANVEAPAVANSDLVVHMRAEDLQYEDSSFDAIVSIHAIEHIPPLDEAMSEMARVLKPGGSALYIYPAEPIKGMFAIPTSIILHGTPFKARQVHCHKLWPSKLRRMAEPLGLVEKHREFNLVKSPQFLSVFEKA
ncbi:MAG: methyltransferase domain-containing protein [Acidimicrobiia bacterium]|nr:methyltransferase domain-containing protein [Acidimicrobiia bacterium]